MREYLIVYQVDVTFIYYIGYEILNHYKKLKFYSDFSE